MKGDLSFGVEGIFEIGLEVRREVDWLLKELVGETNKLQGLHKAWILGAHILCNL
jgi:hypothetical protein